MFGRTGFSRDRKRQNLLCTAKDKMWRAIFAKDLKECGEKNNNNLCSRTNTDIVAKLIFLEFRM